MTAPRAACDDTVEPLLEPLLEAMPGAAAVFECAGGLLAANAHARAAWAVDPQAPLRAQHWSVVLLPLGPDAVAAVEAVARGASAGPAGRAPEAGAPAPVRVVPLPGARVLVSAADDGGRGAAERAPDAVSREVDGVLAALPVPVRVIDAAGAVIRRNPAARAQLPGRATDTVRAWWEQAAPHDVARQRPLSFLEMPAMRALAGGVVTGESIEVRWHGAPRRIAAHALPLRDAAGRVTGAVCVDLPVAGHPADPVAAADAALPAAADAGELERLVEERSQALLATREAQWRDRRLAAVGQLAAGVMHDITNVLNPIMAAAFLLRQHAGDPAAVRDHAERIRTAAETGAALASRVGRFIRQEPLHGGGAEALDLSALAAEVLDFTEPARAAAGRGAVRVERALAPGVWVRGIPGELRAALLNLVQNATDAMAEGGTLTVRAWAGEAGACVAVCDTGRGMSAEVRERAFEPFFTTKGANGSGLGLAEVYGIMRRHQGTAEIASVPGRGTEVVLRLPQHPAPGEGPGAQAHVAGRERPAPELEAGP